MKVPIVAKKVWAYCLNCNGIIPMKVTKKVKVKAELHNTTTMAVIFQCPSCGNTVAITYGDKR